jgi:predicted nucleic acid-binding protein
MVVFDANFLIYFLDPQLKKKANNPRVDNLVATLDKNRDRIVVPTPAMSELLVGAGDAASAYLDMLHRSRFFRIEAFGERAAVEAAAMTRDAKARGDKYGAATDSTWDKVKFDRQIVAIAKVVGANMVYSEDADVRSHAREVGIQALSMADLPEPEIQLQIELDLSPAEPTPVEGEREGEKDEE